MVRPVPTQKPAPFGWFVLGMISANKLSNVRCKSWTSCSFAVFVEFNTDGTRVRPVSPGISESGIGGGGWRVCSHTAQTRRELAVGDV